MIFADKLIKLRKRAGYSQEELAEKMGVTRQSVSKWESAQSIPDIDGDIKTIDDIKSIEGITTNTKGVMIGRGLLENPALAMEYNEGKQMEIGRKVRLLQEFHSLLFNRYSSILQGDSQILSHLQPIWEYLYPEMEKKHRKKIVKCTKISNYLRAVEEALK